MNKEDKKDKKVVDNNKKTVYTVYDLVKKYNKENSKKKGK
jgi:hypothetical protein